jgi:hypothetical protein
VGRLSRRHPEPVLRDADRARRGGDLVVVEPARVRRHPDQPLELGQLDLDGVGVAAYDGAPGREDADPDLIVELRSPPAPVQPADEPRREAAPVELEGAVGAHPIHPGVWSVLRIGSRGVTVGSKNVKLRVVESEIDRYPEFRRRKVCTRV